MGEAVLTIDEQHLYHPANQCALREPGRDGQPRLRRHSLDTLRQMVVMGMGITFLRHCMSPVKLVTPIRCGSPTSKV
ncbi:MAG: hypothetical protein CM15mP74_18690 [Halieaceae bacterium]|nr:MAG: hypothetical protein CM15mP74_18690 [Halieaceae bacterium]